MKRKAKAYGPKILNPHLRRSFERRGKFHNQGLGDTIERYCLELTKIPAHDINELQLPGKVIAKLQKTLQSPASEHGSASHPSALKAWRTTANRTQRRRVRHACQLEARDQSERAERIVLNPISVGAMVF